MNLKEKIKEIMAEDKNEKFTARQIKDALDDRGVLTPQDTLTEIRATLNKFFKARYVQI